jgi:hypothetical protein
MATVIANEEMTDDVGLLDRRECRLLADFVAEIGDQNSEAADAIF